VLGQASYFVWLNRGKESVELDVKSDQGRAALGALLSRADVFVQNLAPGAAERLGLCASELLARHAQLICCSVSGYGPNGPYTSKKAYDLLVQCEAGLLSVTGTPETACKAGISVADIAAGMYAYSGVLTALYEREHTGRGSAFEVSVLDALGEWMSQPYYYTVYGSMTSAASAPGTRPSRPTVPTWADRCFSGCRTTASGPCCASGCWADRTWSPTSGSPPTQTGWPTTTS
jgi:crotonobetainyl-CoA:carnitine CoA-transferase CaiB-like acyl-CoA transferase